MAGGYYHLLRNANRMKVTHVSSSNNRTFQDYLNDALRNPPDKHFVQEIQYSTAANKYGCFYSALVVWNEIPTT